MCRRSQKKKKTTPLQKTHGQVAGSKESRNLKIHKHTPVSCLATVRFQFQPGLCSGTPCSHRPWTLIYWRLKAQAPGAALGRPVGTERTQAAAHGNLQILDEDVE